MAEKVTRKNLETLSPVTATASEPDSRILSLARELQEMGVEVDDLLRDSIRLSRANERPDMLLDLAARLCGFGAEPFWVLMRAGVGQICLEQSTSTDPLGSIAGDPRTLFAPAVSRIVFQLLSLANHPFWLRVGDGVTWDHRLPRDRAGRSSRAQALANGYLKDFSGAEIASHISELEVAIGGGPQPDPEDVPISQFLPPIRRKLSLDEEIAAENDLLKDHRAAAVVALHRIAHALLKWAPAKDVVSEDLLDASDSAHEKRRMALVEMLATAFGVSGRTVRRKLDTAHVTRDQRTGEEIVAGLNGPDRRRKNGPLPDNARSRGETPTGSPDTSGVETEGRRPEVRETDPKPRPVSGGRTRAVSEGEDVRLDGRRNDSPRRRPGSVKRRPPP